MSVKVWIVIANLEKDFTIPIAIGSDCEKAILGFLRTLLKV
jgi:hypothetical protein